MTGRFKLRDFCADKNCQNRLSHQSVPVTTSEAQQRQGASRP